MKSQPRSTASAPKPSPSIRIAAMFRDPVPAPSPKYDGLRAFLQSAGSASATVELLPLVQSVSEAELDALIDRAVEMDPTYEPANFGAWRQIVCPADVDPEEIAAALLKLSQVESAYVMVAAPPPMPVNPADDPRSTTQGYLNAAPGGVDARRAWTVPGGDGAGTDFVVIDAGWNLTHEDLAAANISVISGVNYTMPEHGTGVLGILRMVDNARGGVGIAPASNGRIVGVHRSPGVYNETDAILDAVAHMAFGQVLLIELQAYTASYTPPIEATDPNFNAIRLATALGIIVIEPAGNGTMNLDTYTNAAGRRIFDRTSPQFRDSGAIIVASSTSSVPHGPMFNTNFGNRVDCYAWGQNIVTTSTDFTGSSNILYASNFGGTSGAAAIVAGTALSVQGMALASLGYRIGPGMMRELLTHGGTPSNNPSADRIATMPNLGAIVADDWLNAVPDVYLRDYVGDTGARTSGIVSASPDIFVRTAQVPNPQAAYGAGSPDVNNPYLSQPIYANADHYVYVRLLNKGSQDMTNVRVDVYYAPTSTLVTPNTWRSIGATIAPLVPAGNVLTVPAPILWSSIFMPFAGHYCFVAVASSADDPAPVVTSFATFDEYTAFIRNNNNVASRNFNVYSGPKVPIDGGYIVAGVQIRGGFRSGRRFGIQGSGRLPAGSRVYLDVPAWLADALKPHQVEVSYDAKRGTARIPMNPSGTSDLGVAYLHADSVAECTLGVLIPKKYAGNQYEYFVRQIDGEVEVGRVTWMFAPDEKAPQATASSKKRSSNI